MSKYISVTTFSMVHWKALDLIMWKGLPIPTDYDKEDELPSLDLPLFLEIYHHCPDNPYFSKCVHNSAKGLFEYRDEVVYGTNNDRIKDLGYTYHDRLYLQFDGILQELKRNLQSRRAQAITWQPENDLGSMHPPCLQRIWFRLVDGRLDMHTHWRSRDMFKAWGSNVFAMYFLHKLFADKLNLEIGCYREFIDSAHVYGRDRENIRKLLSRGLSDWQWSLEDITKEALADGYKPLTFIPYNMEIYK